MQEKIKSFIYVILCMTILGLLSVFLLGYKNFSQDELDTVYVVADWSKMLHIIYSFEGNMWLYYLVAYFWQFFGHTEVVFRLLAVLFAVLTVPFVYLIGKLLFNEKVARLASLLISIHVFVIISAQFARGYTMVLFFTTLSSYLFTKYILTGTKKYLFGLSLINALAVYSHLYAVFIIAAQFLSVLFLNKKKQWSELIITFSLTGFLFIPLFLAPSLHGGQLNWLPQPTVINLVGTFMLLSNDFLPLGMIYGLLFVGFFFNLLKKRISIKWKPSLLLWQYAYPLLCIIIPIVTAFLFSILVKPMYQSPYFIVSLVPFTFFVALAVYSLPKTWFRNSIVTLIVLLVFVRLYGWYTESTTIVLTMRNYNEDWQKTASFLATHMQKDDAVLFSPPSGQYRINYYVQKQHYESLPNQEAVQASYMDAGSDTYKVDTQKLASLSQAYSRVWFVYKTVIDTQTEEANNIINTTILKDYVIKTKTSMRDFEIVEYIRK